MILQIAKKHWITALCALVLLVCFAAVCIVNFSANPTFYSADMYTDMVYAIECWEHKSIFPEGWIFGNQLYAVATPVLAALFYGMCHDALVAMALAATVMGIMVLVSFVWMVKAVFPGVRSGVLGAAIFMVLPLSFGGAAIEVDGWQLFFTMCSFYACYAIAAFLAFGSYIRSEKKPLKTLIIPLMITCIMAFGTGLQSLRQTLVMTCPLVAVEGLRILWRLWKKETPFGKTTVVCLLIALCNVAGVLGAKIAQIPQVEIFGKIAMTPWADAIKNVQSSAANVLSLLGVKDKLLAVLVLVGGGFFLLFLWEKLRKQENRAGIVCVLLFAVSLAGVLVLDTFTTMYIRSIYYFLLYPLLALAGVALFVLGGGRAKAMVAALLILMFASGAQERLPDVLKQARQPVQYEETVSFLKEKGITTVFSGWNRGEKLAIASGGSIKAAFWNSYKKPFVPVKYLCDPAGFDVAPETCAYVFFYASEAELAANKAKEQGVELQFIQYIAADGIYIYTSDENLMTRK